MRRKSLYMLLSLAAAILTVTSFSTLFNGSNLTVLGSDNKKITSHVFEIIGFAFRPDNLTVSVGTKIIWHNSDSSVHTVDSHGELFNSVKLRNAEEVSYVFDKPGVYEFYCRLHPWMNGKVTVEE